MQARVARRMAEAAPQADGTDIASVVFPAQALVKDDILHDGSIYVVIYEGGSTVRVRRLHAMQGDERH